MAIRCKEIATVSGKVQEAPVGGESDHGREPHMIQEIAKLFGATSARKTDALVKQVVDASIAGVCQRVAQHIDAMSLFEARGYVRARAARVVRRQTRLAINHLPEDNSAWSETIVRAATERLLPVVLQRMSVGIPRSSSLPIAA
ncbi:MAG: hypothetical protein MI725_01385 [Pirellulales bacterium]|nr:hypothetical protein [Pirellulales bacterium]